MMQLSTGGMMLAWKSNEGFGTSEYRLGSYSCTCTTAIPELGMDGLLLLLLLDLATESPLLETFQNCRGFTDVVLKTESCIMRAN